MTLKPEKLPIWATEDAEIEVPVEEKQAWGWRRLFDTTPEFPFFPYVNWWKNLVFQWLTYFNSEVVTEIMDETQRVRVTVVAELFTVTYVGNGATGGTEPVDSTWYEEGQTVTVRGNTNGLLKTGYVFLGWNTEIGGTGATYTQGQTFEMGSDPVILYAHWELTPTYRVTYDENGATGGAVPVDSTWYEEGQAVTVWGNTGSLVRTGYTFVDWTPYEAEQTFSMPPANVTLYARWTLNPAYSVTYLGNENTDGIPPTDSNWYEAGQAVTVLGNTAGLVRTGYTFGGWNTEELGTGTAYSSGQTFEMPTANVVLYARWVLRVLYSGNGSTGGDVPVDPTGYEVGDTVTVLGNTGGLLKTGGSFAGWNTAADGTGAQYNGGDTFVIALNTTLYVGWRYEVMYDGNGNTGGTPPIDPSSPYFPGALVTVMGNTGALVKTPTP